MSFWLKQDWYRPPVTDGRSPVIKLVHSFTVMVSPNLPPLASLGAAAVKNSFPISAVSHLRGSTYICLWAGQIKVWDSTTKEELKAYCLQLGGVTPRYVKSKWNLGTPWQGFQTSFWCMRNTDANPTARVATEGVNRSIIPHSAVQARKLVFCQMGVVDKQS